MFIKIRGDSSVIAQYFFVLFVTLMFGSNILKIMKISQKAFKSFLSKVIQLLTLTFKNNYSTEWKKTQ